MSVASKLLSGGQDDRWKASTLLLDATTSFVSDTPFFKPDGLVFFATTEVSSQYRLRQYSVSTAWDLSSPTLVHSTSIDDANTIFVSDDGLKLYYSNFSGDMLEYDISSAWDLSSGLTLSNTFSPGHPCSNFFFKNGGNLFVVRDTIFPISFKSYELSTPWDTSTATLLATSSVGDDGEGIFLKPDGTKLYSGKGGTGSAIFREYIMSSPWDVTTLSLNATSSVVDRGRFFIKNDGSRLFKTKDDRFNPVIQEYSMG